MAHQPIHTRTVPHTGSHQRLYRFPNGYGASVVSGGIGVFGEQELAVLRFASESVYDFHLVYDTPITNDVLGYLNDAAVDSLLDDIAALPNPAQVSA